MKQAISFINLGVGDLARSRAFYRALGWRESSGSRAAVDFYQAGSVAFALFARDSLAEDDGAPPQGAAFAGFTLAHNVPSEEAADATLRTAAAVAAASCAPASKRPGAATAAISPSPTAFSGKSASILSFRWTRTGLCSCLNRRGVAGECQSLRDGREFSTGNIRPLTALHGRLKLDMQMVGLQPRPAG